MQVKNGVLLSVVCGSFSRRLAQSQHRFITGQEQAITSPTTEELHAGIRLAEISLKSQRQASVVCREALDVCSARRRIRRLGSASQVPRPQRGEDEKTHRQGQKSEDHHQTM